MHDTSKKVRQFALHFFIHKNPDTLLYAIFHRIFEIGGWGGCFYKQKNNVPVSNQLKPRGPIFPT